MKSEPGATYSNDGSPSGGPLRSVFVRLDWTGEAVGRVRVGVRFEGKVWEEGALVGVLHCGTLDDMSPGQSRRDGENSG
jgi:hypothetical protein